MGETVTLALAEVLEFGGNLVYKHGKNNDDDDDDDCYDNDNDDDDDNFIYMWLLYIV